MEEAGYVLIDDINRIPQMKNDLDTVKLYAAKLKEQLAEAYDLCRFVYGNVPPQYLPVSFLDRMNALYNEMASLGVEVDQ